MVDESTDTSPEEFPLASVRTVVETGGVTKTPLDPMELLNVHQAALKPLITVRQQVYHRDAPLGQPREFATIFSRAIDTDEQPYSRPKGKATEDWTDLKYGWLDDSGVSLLLIKNEEGVRPSRVPTVEQSAEIAEKVIEIGVSTATGVMDLFEVHPTETCGPLLLTASSFKKFCIRCRKGTAAYTLTALPR